MNPIFRPTALARSMLLARPVVPTIRATGRNCPQESELVDTSSLPQITMPGRLVPRLAWLLARFVAVERAGGGDTAA